MGKLTILGTPIGNIEDISIRAIKKIFTSTTVIAEDTRNFIKLKNLLFQKYTLLIKEILKEHDSYLNEKQNLISYRENNHKKIIVKILNILKKESCTLVSDAGMPVISDPGLLLVQECINNNIDIEIIPSTTAFECALILSGFPINNFTFLGFLPKTPSKIKKIITENIKNTICFYESPYRLIKNLEIIKSISQNFMVSLSNDITKKFEKTIRGNIKEVIEVVKNSKILGEWVVTIKCLDKNFDQKI